MVRHYLNNVQMFDILYIYMFADSVHWFVIWIFKKQINITWIYSKFCDNNKWILILIFIFMVQHQFTWNNTINFKLLQNWQTKQKITYVGQTIIDKIIHENWQYHDHICMILLQTNCKNFAPGTTATTACNFIHDWSTMYRYLHNWQYFSDLNIFSTHEKFSF